MLVRNQKSICRNETQSDALTGFPAGHNLAHESRKALLFQASVEIMHESFDGHQKVRVFKYRSLSRGAVWRDLRALAHNKMYCAPPEKMNDPFEAHVVINGESFEISRVLGLLPGIRCPDDILSAEQRFLSALCEFVEKTKSYGIYSLSKSCTDELLWAYYADSHKGICIEYDLKMLLDCMFGAEKPVDIGVQYEPKVPIVALTDLRQLDKDSKPLLTKLLGTKSTRWGHEGEIRVVTGQTGLLEYDFRAVKGIYFGYRCDARFQRVIMKIMKGRKTPFFRMDASDGSYGLKPVPLADPYHAVKPYRERIAPVQAGVPHFDRELEPYRALVEKAIEIVRRDPYCDLVTEAYLARKDSSPGDPVFYVSYDHSDGLPKNRHFRKSEIEAHVLA